MSKVKCASCNFIWDSKATGRCPSCDSSIYFAVTEEMQKPPRIPEFIKTIEHIKELHQKKNNDYATDTNPFSNFDFADSVNQFALGCGCEPTHLPFINHISTKLSRLFVLLRGDSVVNNESIEDSFDDLATYIILWKCRYLKQNGPTL